MKFSHRWLTVVLFILALAPRLLAIGRYVTPDELMWVQRAVTFRQALLAGDWANTIVTGHPGVTTTWLGALGIWLQLLLRPGDTAVYDWITHLAWMTPDNITAFQQLAQFLTAGRVTVALVNSLGLVLAYGLARPLLGDRAALLGFVLLALDPFVAGLSGLLHVDGLLMTFALIALLALARAVQGEGAEVWATAVSGAAAALAFLSKSPGLLLAPLAVLWIWAGGFWAQRTRRGRGETAKNNGEKQMEFRVPVLQSMVWLASFAIVAAITLPALVTAPGQVWRVVSGESGRHIEEALRPTFFWGQAAFDHGLLFYPVALALRLGPVVLVGLLLFLVRLLRRAIWRQDAAKEHAGFAIWLLLLWAVGFVMAITLAAKKFDRYALPAIPALTLLGAWGWAQWRASWRRWLLPGVALAQLAYLLAFLPYPLAAFNPLVGGPWLAQRTITVGWGEAIGAAGQWLAAQPGAAEATAVADMPPALAPFFPGQTLPNTPEDQAQADYLIVTLNGRQLDGAAEQPPVPGATLLHVVRYGGLDQAWIYRNPAPQPPPDLPQTWLQPMTFGGQVQLWGLDALPLEEKLAVYAQWGLVAPTEHRFTVKLTLRDAAGQDWGGVETALLNDVYFYPAHWAAGIQPVVRYELARPKGLPPGSYTVELALFDAQGAQLAVVDGDGAFRGVTVRGEPVTVPPRATIPALGAEDLPLPAGFSWLDGALWLRGYAPLPSQALTGERLALNLVWQAERPLPAHLMITLTLGGVVVAQQPLSGYDTGLWRAGEWLQEKVTLRVPPDFPGGKAALALQVADGVAVVVAEIELGETDRLFDLPQNVPVPLAYDFGGVLALRGMDDATGRAGETAVFALYWQVVDQPADLYTVFVHLLAEDGRIVTQSDQWPGGRPTDSYVPGEVVIDQVHLDLPPDLAPGAYALRVGVYTAADGARLPVQGEEFIILPVGFAVESTVD